MKNVLNHSFGLYSKELLKVMLLSLITYVPLLFIHAFIVNYIYELSRNAEYPGVAGDFANGVIMLVFLTIAQVPFIRFTLLDHQDEDRLVASSLSFFIDRIIPLYIFSCLYAFVVYLGGFLFVIPGMIVLLFLYFVPFFISESGKDYKRAIQKSIKFVRRNFWKCFLMIILLSILQLFFENILIFILQLYTNSYFTLLLTKILLLMFILPFQTIMLTNLFLEWKETKE